MKMFRKILIFFILTLQLNSQTFLHPTIGTASTYVGACMVNACSGTYYDNGGSGGNYSNNINSVYRVFCPTSPSNCVRLTFTSFDVEFQASCLYDYLTIGNGPTQNSPVFTTPPALNPSGRICGTPAVPFSYTSSDASGCLSVRFRSDFIINRPGWAANISCVPCSQVQGGLNNDCSNFTAICGNSSFSGNSPGPGFNSESCTGCTAGGENFSNWYFFQVQTGGSFGFTITPQSPTGDYDYALYGPNVTCASLGSPIRCSYAANTGPTGLGNGATDTSEGVTGDAWTSTISVTAGQSFYLMINQWEATANGFTINFGGTAVLNCAVLPVELKSMQCEAYVNGNLISFETNVEYNTDYFILERAGDDLNFEEVGKVPSRRMPSQYVIMDEKPRYGTTYYRLIQSGKDRSRQEIGKIISCQNFYRKNYFYRIFDMSGKLIVEGDYEGNDIQEFLRNNVAVPQGIFLVHLYEGAGKFGIGQVFKMVKTSE